MKRICVAFLIVLALIVSVSCAPYPPAQVTASTQPNEQQAGQETSQPSEQPSEQVEEPVEEQVEEPVEERPEQEAQPTESPGLAAQEEIADLGALNTPLTPNPLTPKKVEPNPFMAQTENSVHADNYNSDTTDFVLPIGINSEVNTAYETESTNAPPSVFYDSLGNAYAPYISTGIAVRDLDSEIIETLGSYYPATDDDHPYAIQQSYSFIDSDNNIVAPTTDNRIIMLRSLDEEGNVLEKFEKILDVNIAEVANAVMGEEFTQTLMSIVYDYSGNLWFSTGGFRIYPERQETGFIGYISRGAIDDILAGIEPDLTSEVHFYALEPGEGTENGIASSPEGAVVLTNMACYLLSAGDGVDVKWRVTYDSNGENSGSEDSATSGGGLSWGSGTSPALSNEYVFFADNTDPINLNAVEIATGELVDALPVIDSLPADMPVSIDNAAIAYEGENGDVGVVLCNWFGASNPGLSDPDSDSSIQSYDNLYNPDWIANGNVAIMPGIERVDLTHSDGEAELVSVWSREDLRSTAMFKLSTATGYLYGYAQDMETSMWQYVILDYETGETVYTYDVSSLAGYNNMAVGMFSNPETNALYCPTGNFELLRMQDRFAYLTLSPYREIPLDDMGRAVVSEESFVAGGGVGTPASWLHNVKVSNATDAEANVSVSLLINGIEGNADDFTLYASDDNGAFAAVPAENWSIETPHEVLDRDTVYEVIVRITDDGEFDNSDEENTVDISVMLAN